MMGRDRSGSRLCFVIILINLTIKHNNMNLHVYSQDSSSRHSSLYNSKTSKKQHQKSNKLISIQNSCEFSFNKGQYDSGKTSIREDLVKLSREDLIDLVLQEVEQTKLLRIKLATMQDQFKIMGSFREEPSQFGDTHEYVSMSKYKQLTDYMEEYISNTNEAQTFFANLIRELRAESMTIKQANKKYEQEIQLLKSQTNTQHELVVKELEETIHNLEDSLTHYMNINNEHTRKYEKLKKMYDSLEQQLATALDSFHHEDDSLQEVLKQCNNKENIVLKKGNGNKDDEELKERIKILEIQNGQLKESWSAMEKALEGKSEKIRKLLQEMQKLSEQKWIYKQKYMELKSKSFAYTQSSASKNTVVFDSCTHNEVHVEEYNSLT